VLVAVRRIPRIGRPSAVVGVTSCGRGGIFSLFASEESSGRVHLLLLGVWMGEHVVDVDAETWEIEDAMVELE
jgi:hypothetical protein